MKPAPESEVASRILAFVKEFWPGTEPQLSTRLNEDLGITGDDACELMTEFANRFGVDLESFRFHAHFENEGDSPGSLFLLAGIVGACVLLGMREWLLGIACLLVFVALGAWWSRRASRGHGMLSVEDLVRAAQAGNWNYDYGSDSAGDP